MTNPSLRTLARNHSEYALIEKSIHAAVKGMDVDTNQAETAAALALTLGVHPGVDLARFLERMATQASAATVRMDEMARMHTKVEAVGMVRADALGRVAAAGIPIFQALADLKDTTSERVRDLVAQGEVTAIDFQAAMSTACAAKGGRAA